MQSAPLSQRHSSPRGIPRWLLFASMPLILSLGFVSGVALSIYLAVPVPDSPPTTQEGLESHATPEETATSPGPAVQAGNLPDSSPPGLPIPPPTRPVDRGIQLPPVIDDSPLRTAPSPGPGAPATGPVTSPSTPAATYGLAVRDRADARSALAAEFSRYLIDGEVAFTVDYQVARDSRQNTVLVGIVKIGEYSEWVREVREHPDRLEAWLSRAAERVRPAAQKEGFHLTWTIFEVVSDVPYGFAAREVTRTPSGGYVVTRPLAAVVDVAKSSVAVASVADLSQGSAASLPGPWAAYGPVLRFDSTDLYRPVGTNSNKP